MMIAIGAPGALPRAWLDTESPAVLAANLEPGEVASSVDLGPDGRPVPVPLVAGSTVTFVAKRS